MADSQPIPDQFPVYPRSARVRCSWCKADLGPHDGERDSHGACSFCARKLGEQVDEIKPRLRLVGHMRELLRLGQLDTPGRLRSAAGAIVRRGL